MDKENEIQELTYFLLQHGVTFNAPQVAKNLINADYRKADKIQRETAREIYRKLIQAKSAETIHYDCRTVSYEYVYWDDIQEIFNGYGVEVK